MIPSIETIITSTQYNYHGHTYEMGMMVASKDVKTMMKEYAIAVINECAQRAEMYNAANKGYDPNWRIDKESITRLIADIK